MHSLACLIRSSVSVILRRSYSPYQTSYHTNRYASAVSTGSLTAEKPYLSKRSDIQSVESMSEVEPNLTAYPIITIIRPEPVIDRTPRWKQLYKAFMRSRKARKHFWEKQHEGYKEVHDLNFLSPRVAMAEEKAAAYATLAQALMPEDCTHIDSEDEEKVRTPQDACASTEAYVWLDRMNEASALTGHNCELFDPRRFQDQIEYLQWQDGRRDSLPRRVKLARKEFKAVVYKDVEAAAEAAELYSAIHKDLMERYARRVEYEKALRETREQQYK